MHRWLPLLVFVSLAPSPFKCLTITCLWEKRIIVMSHPHVTTKQWRFKRYDGEYREIKTLGSKKNRSILALHNPCSAGRAQIWEENIKWDCLVGYRLTSPSLREHLPKKNVFFRALPEWGWEGRPLPELKNTLYIFLSDGRKRCTSCLKDVSIFLVQLSSRTNVNFVATD